MSKKDESSDKRIRQMVNFIRLEAKEKAEEIELKADEEFQIEKGKILNPERVKLKQEFDRKRKDLEVKRRIEYSTQINESRLKVLKKREEMMGTLKGQCEERLSELRGGSYKTLLRNLIVQGMIRIDEDKVEVNVLKEDVGLAKSVIADAQKEFKKSWSKVISDVPKVEVSVNESSFLSTEMIGGVVLKARGGRIVLDNTLRSRMNVAFDALLPQIRGRLFGITPHTGVIYEDEAGHGH